MFADATSNPTRFRIKRTGIRHFRRSEVTAVPLNESD
jgi:hypothetical protein